MRVHRYMAVRLPIAADQRHRSSNSRVDPATVPRDPYRFVIHDRCAIDVAMVGFGVRVLKTPVRYPEGERIL